EFGHRWGGVILLAMSLAAFARQATGAKSMRHWPAAFVVLILFVGVCAVVQRWKYGWHLEPPEVAEIFQHAILFALALAWGLAQWGFETQILNWRHAAFVFPLSAALGATLLLVHFHSDEDVGAAAFPMRIAHLSIAVAAIAGAALRWIEVR